MIADSPWCRLLLASLGLLFLVKLVALAVQRSKGKRFVSLLGLVAFQFAWPGVIVDGFLVRKAEPPPETGKRFLEAWLTFLGGCLLFVTAALVGGGRSTEWNYVGLFSILLIIHLGLVEVVADGLRLLDFSPTSLFDRPFLASSLRDFWSTRWNRAFVDMNKLFISGPLKNKVPAAVLTFSIFLVSGLLHEFAISFPDGVSWGWPMSYFALQGLGVLVEKRWRFPRALVIAWVVLPVPLLFTPAFTNLFIGDLQTWVSQFVFSLSQREWLRYGLALGGAMHALVLVASIQVPSRLGWKEDFSRLRPLNRKTVWTYGGYILATIVFMGATSFYLATSDDVATGPARVWIGYITLFWIARIAIDFFYMKHDDWPKGPLFDVGHVCLSTLFITMAATYAGLSILLATGEVR